MGKHAAYRAQSLHKRRALLTARSLAAEPCPVQHHLATRRLCRHSHELLAFHTHQRHLPLLAPRVHSSLRTRAERRVPLQWRTALLGLGRASGEYHSVSPVRWVALLSLGAGLTAQSRGSSEGAGLLAGGQCRVSERAGWGLCYGRSVQELYDRIPTHRPQRRQQPRTRTPSGRVRLRAPLLLPQPQPIHRHALPDAGESRHPPPHARDSRLPACAQQRRPLCRSPGAARRGTLCVGPRRRRLLLEPAGSGVFLAPRHGRPRLGAVAKFRCAGKDVWRQCPVRHGYDKKHSAQRERDDGYVA